MINYFMNSPHAGIVGFVGVLFAYIATCLALGLAKEKLPRDHGRQFAHDGVLSAGKPRGAGFVFILIFVLTAILFGDLERELIIYLILTVAAMITGFLDDCAKVSWGELRKGLLDLIIAIMTAITMVNFNGSDVLISFTGQVITLHPVVYIILAIILVWASINVTNCADGVDGLSGTLASISLITIYIIMKDRALSPSFMYLILVFVVLGGIGNIRGSIIAAAILTILPEVLRGLSDYRMLIYAVVLIAMMLFNWAPAAINWKERMKAKIKSKNVKEAE